MLPSRDARPAGSGDAPGARKSASRGAVRCAALFLAAVMHPLPASAQKVRITNLSDVNFGLISNLQADSRQSQNICLYSNTTGSRYSVAASGSGTGSSFALSSGSDSLAYEVEWSDQSGQTTGTGLAPNVAVTGQASSATHQFCNSGPATSASLTIVFRSSDLSQAREGSYSGSLTLLVAAE
jgi:hypothetical protein